MLSRKKFKASVMVRDALAENPNGNRKSLVSAARRATQQADDASMEKERREIVPPVHCVEKGRVYCMFSTTAVLEETSDTTTTVMMQCCERS